MDGFFVAKIQKLSDKILSQEDPEEAAVDNEEDEEEMEEVPEKVPEKKKPTKGKKSPFSKKRKGETAPAVEEKAKKNKMSIAPGTPTSTKKKSKKTRMNAKMTQPRRRKAAADIAAADI
jgi:hypothetical protein